MRAVMPGAIEEVVENPTITGRFMVVIFNNDTNTVEEVVAVLMCATGCTLEEASIETWEAHHYGQAPVHFAGREACQEIAGVISQIGVKTEVRPEWID